MATAKVFSNGDSQIVALPKNFHINGEEVYVNRIADVLILVPTNRSAEDMMQTPGLFTDDFMEDFMNNKQIQ
ncbi:MAG: AbrB/MazE/SpoVT family DNA-binding domain-containing protein [Selenomonadaceae bacterium]|nr:AbrB/MazE/SpoVT family DNA-binding domain-containing protein [Selenomonadaceae bacterium]